MASEKKAYDFSEIEPRWHKQWEEDGTYKAVDFDSRPKKYILVEFPYPSGDGLHVGHCVSYIAQDIIARQARMQGYNVLYPMGWDAFGLPTENYAIKTKTKPQEVAEKNIANFKRQIQSLGISFDWSREVNTTDPNYYKWTQWIFLQMFKHGLAEKKEVPINWCPKDKIGLAFEEVIDGKCERCGTPVERRNIKQWVLKITQYADRLIDDLDTVDFLPEIKQAQVNWIGRSEGALIKFQILNTKFQRSSNNQTPNSKPEIAVFTTRPDTLFGATYLVLAPEHEIIKSFESVIQNQEEVTKYIKSAIRKTERERQESKEKTGVELKGVTAVNPANGEEIPIWVADYVLSGYGTGAIMAVPAHDERDFEFAKKHKLPIRQVILRPSQCVVVHGCPSKDEDRAEKRTYDKHWMPWLKGKLDEQGINNVFPLMPTPWTPQYEKWKKVFEGLEIDEGSVLIGHSCGSAFLVRWLGETKKRIRKLILVAPWKIPRSGSPEEKVEFYSYEIDKSIRERIQEIVLFTADDEEPEGKESVKIFHNAIGGRIAELRRHGHYTFGDMGTEEFPELLNEIMTGEEIYCGTGLLVDSGEFTGIDSEEAKWKITEKIGGKKTVQYKLRDWIFSRQHYWGEPIPIIHCETCGPVPVPEKDLPVVLPDVEFYEPTDTGESPLAKITDWVNTKCPKCEGPAKRETDTMPNWAGSSWYFLRYTDSNNKDQLADKKNLEYWLPVDMYNGGSEHTTLHLLYSRFWHKFLYDIKVVPTLEPYHKRVQHGMILASDGQKMSKSRGNVINPDDIVARYGADVFRLYMLFMGEYDQTKSWNEEHIKGVYRFMKAMRNHMIHVRLEETSGYDAEVAMALNLAIIGISEDLKRRSFNTAVSKLMICWNAMGKLRMTRSSLEIWAKLLAPFVPHFAESVWRDVLGNHGSVHIEKWPEPNNDLKLFAPQEIRVGIQINGKVRGDIVVTENMNGDDVRSAVMALPHVQKYITGKTVKKFIYIPKKIVSIVV